MKDQLVSFETAKLAKEKRFNIITNKYYNPSNPLAIKHDLSIVLLDNKLNENYNHCSYAWLCLAPSQIMLQKWLWEKHKYYVYVLIDINGKFHWAVANSKGKIIDIQNSFKEKLYNDFSLPFEIGLRKALQLIE